MARTRRKNAGCRDRQLRRESRKITRSAVVTGRACDRSLLSAGARWSRQRVTRLVTRGGAFRFVPAEGFSDLCASRTKSQTALGRRALSSSTRRGLLPDSKRVWGTVGFWHGEALVRARKIEHQRKIAIGIRGFPGISARCLRCGVRLSRDVREMVRQRRLGTAVPVPWAGGDSRSARTEGVEVRVFLDPGSEFW